jgi:hypothetical protein
LEAEDAILLVATGEVVAGVDLTQLSPKDVVVDERTNTVHIVLPLAEVFSSHLDNERTYVHTRSTDALAQRQTHLESRARQEAEREFEKAATDGGILLQAETQVALTVKALLSSLGFDVVQVSFRQVSSSEK